MWIRDLALCLGLCLGPPLLHTMIAPTLLGTPLGRIDSRPRKSDLLPVRIAHAQ